MWLLRSLLIVTLCYTGTAWAAEQARDAPHSPASSWNLYTNSRFGYSVRYPSDWHAGENFRDGSGVLLTPSTPHSQVGFTGFLNLAEGKSQDGRQTLDEFASAHHRIMEEHYGKKNIALKWQEDRSVTLGGFPARQFSFSYQDENKTEMIELHIFSVGRNEGRGVRMKFPAASRAAMMPVLAEMLKTYQAGRDQNAVSPFQAPAEGKPREQSR